MYAIQLGGIVDGGHASGKNSSFVYKDAIQLCSIVDREYTSGKIHLLYTIILLCNPIVYLCTQEVDFKKNSSFIYLSHDHAPHKR